LLKLFRHRSFGYEKNSSMLKAGFILLAITLALILYAGAGNIAGKTFTRVVEKKQFRRRTAIVLIVWLLYISLLSIAGVFTVSTLPPRIPLLLILPAFVFFAFLFTGRKFKKIVENTPSSWPVYFQSFRVIVELLLLGLYLQGMLPKAATFEGSNFDIIIGITAPLVGYYIFNKGTPGKIFVFIWNIAGLVTLSVVVSILLSHAYFYRHLNENESILNKGLGQFPFVFLAGFFMPLAVFMHLFSIVRMKTN
jgi:hypothetical protein